MADDRGVIKLEGKGAIPIDSLINESGRGQVFVRRKGCVGPQPEQRPLGAMLRGQATAAREEVLRWSYPTPLTRIPTED